LESSARDLRALLAHEDHDALAVAAGANARRVLRYLAGRLCSADEPEKWRAVRALGHLSRDRAVLSASRVEELLRRFLWALNDESGAVPYGVPEAMAEVLANRPEFLSQYLPILGSCLDSEDMGQTGLIERGVIWGLGRLGPAVAEHAPHAVEALGRIAANHPDEETRRVAVQALGAIRD
jgi:HEAT repeat protein